VSISIKNSVGDYSKQIGKTHHKSVFGYTDAAAQFVTLCANLQPGRKVRSQQIFCADTHKNITRNV
jgi:hypothetical protein